MRIKKFLKIPEDYSVAFVSGSATGAMELLLWNLLGPRYIDILTFGDVFAECWRYDIQHQLKLPYCEHNQVVHNPDNDLVFVHNLTSIGLCIPDFDFMTLKDGLIIADLTSSVFCMPVDWGGIDAAAFSFQKGIGGNAGLGMIVLSPRSFERLEQFTPEWPIPRLFRLKTMDGKLNKPIFEGYTINTPSLLSFYDLEKCLDWAESAGDLHQKTKKNFNVVKNAVESSPHLQYLQKIDGLEISPTSPCFTVKHFHTRDDYLKIARRFEQANIAYDIMGHSLVPPCFRIWCGPTIEESELKLFFEHFNALVAPF